MRLEGYVHGFEIDADHSLHIYQGSLVRVQADALVSSDNNYLSAEVGVSLALALAAGFDVDRERQQIVQEHRPTLGEVVRTSGGGLPCRYLYHAITIDIDRNASMDEAALRKLIANLLKQATADGVASIGMPALGTGAVSFNLDRAPEIIIDELLIRLVDTPIQRVILALMGNEAERPAAALHAITTGNNGDFAAGPGWNACTGLGSPDGDQIAALLASARTS